MSSTSKSNGQNPKILEPKPQCEMEKQKRNWLDLPDDLTANILYKVGAIDILENAQKVCTTWRKISKDPALWRVIYMENTCPKQNAMWRVTYFRLGKMCKHAVDLSQGQLVDITIVNFGDDELLRYIADRSSRLRRLELAGVIGGIHFTKAFEKLPLLEELNLYSTSLSEESIALAGRCCPMLTTMKMNDEADRHYLGYDPRVLSTKLNETPIAIGENMHGLRHLELIGMTISNAELQVILDGCCHLESLDLRECLYVNLDGEFGKKCSENIKCLKLSDDSLEGCPYLYKNGDRYTKAVCIDFNDPDNYYSETMALFREFLGVGDDGLIDPERLESLL